MVLEVEQTGVRVGVVGLGYWGPKHLRVLHALPSVSSLVAIDRDPRRLDVVHDFFPSVRTFASLTAALPHVDAVIVAAPPSAHVPLALAAVEAGKHVLVEKPLSEDTAGGLRLVEAARAAGVTLMVGHTFEYNPAVWKLKDIVGSGELGDVYYVDTARLNLGLYQHDVNVIHDLAPHDVSILNHVLGVRPTTVEAWASRHAHHHLEDVAYLRLGYQDLDLTAHVHVSWLDPHKVRRVTAVGSRKMAVYNDLASDERIRVHDKGVVRGQETGDVTTAPMSYRYGDIVSPFVASLEPLAVQDEHFVDCVQTGSRPRTDGLNGLAVVQVLEAAQRSIALGRTIRLDDELPVEALVSEVSPERMTAARA